MKRWLPLLAVVALLAGACTSPSASAACDLPGVRPGVCLVPEQARQAAPTAAVPVLGSEDELSLTDYEGEVVVANFWASWCGPCRAEQPELNDAAELFDDAEVAFLGVNVQDSEVNARAHVDEFDIPYPSVYDPQTAYTARFEGIGPRSIPSTVIIDRQGRVAARLFGTTNVTEVTVLVERLLSG